ncbi:MAG: sulfatase [Candidatus Omnitrophica bacterium]|nr:sulfatase [Candidatus Omnitrophota bacterium]MCM8832297.1 sulfatase [Candidatus Omnitrophota bacterium]
MGCYGAPVKTPNIDKLAEEGVIFTNYFCSAPQCSPSRASMFSGLMPHNNGVYGLSHRGFTLKKDIPYLPKILKENGYETVLFGIQHETKWEKVETLGYNKINKGKTCSCIDITPILIDYLDSKPPQPFFISVGFEETHLPWPVVENIEENLKVPDFLPNVIEVKKDMAGFNIVIERVDKSINEIIKALKRNKLYDNTLIILTTDHGLPLPGAKATLFDPGIGIFLIIRGEGFEGGEKFDCLSSNIDLMPTILDYLGIEIPENVQGKSLIPVIRGEKQEIREEIYTELTYHAGYDPMRSVRTKKYKYIKFFEFRPFYYPPNVDPSFSKEYFRKIGYFEKIRPFEMFFDLEKDRLERENLIGNPEYKEKIEELKNKLLEWMKETNDPILNGPFSPPENAVISPPWAYHPKTLWYGEEKWT